MASVREESFFFSVKQEDGEILTFILIQRFCFVFVPILYHQNTKMRINKFPDALNCVFSTNKDANTKSFQELCLVLFRGSALTTLEARLSKSLILLTDCSLHTGASQAQWGLIYVLTGYGGSVFCVHWKTDHCWKLNKKSMRVKLVG